METVVTDVLPSSVDVGTSAATYQGMILSKFLLTQYLTQLMHAHDSAPNCDTYALS